MGAVATRVEEHDMSDTVINVANDFTKSPGGRYTKDGSFSGELFRENFLVPRIRDAVAKSNRVIVELDGTFGYASSFLDEAFGGLVREGYFDQKTLSKILSFRAIEPHVKYYKLLAEQFMTEATENSSVRERA
jgi:hypothetical protein